ncbi:MAG: ABC transporter permease [Actinomycetota bacterium]|jgi:putative ABC transport system permease protein|nr:MAG: ABC transporter permease [Actinomycetota bacterium]
MSRSTPTPPRLEPSRLRPTHLLLEAALDIQRRPGRATLTGLGTLLGIWVLVAAYGMAQTVEAQIGDRFDLLEATQVTVTDAASGEQATPPFPRDAEDRLERLNGVVAAGVIGEVAFASPAELRALWIPGAPEASYPVFGASAGFLEAADLTVERGRTFTEEEEGRRELVALIGLAPKADLQLGATDGRATVWIDGVPFTVIGTIADVGRRADLLTAVVIPLRTAEALWGIGSPEILVETAPGAAQLIGQQAAAALRPEDPERLRVAVPPSPDSLRRQVEGDLRSLVLGLGAVILGVGAIQIANATLVSVLHRVHEIGLRRAVGARAFHVAAQFLVQSGALGFVGGAVGAQAGLLSVALVAAVRRWTLVADPWLLLVGPLLGLAVGTLAGAYPAWRAAGIQPVDALRR